MVKSRLLILAVCLTLLLAIAGGFSPVAVSADDSTPTPTPSPTPPPTLTLKCDVPSYSDNSGMTFNYSVTLTYNWTDTVVANLSLTNPPGWNSYITYSGKEISSIPIGPYAYGSPDSKMLSVSLSPNSGYSPDPGEYKLTLKATSGDMSASIDLTAIVKAKYSFSMSTDSGNLATTAQAGKETHFSFNLNNTGSAALDNLTLNASKPSDWTITFNPSKIDSLSAGQSQQVDAIIKPPEGKTVAGDYMITLRSSNDKVSSSMDVRVTVEASSIWGVVSIGIIVVVIGGLAGLFLKLGRR